MTRLLFLLISFCGLLLAQAPDVKAVVNSASFTVGVAPGSLVSIFGTNLAAASVLVNGRAAPVLYSGPTQINAQLPFELTPGPATLSVGASSLSIQVSAAAPGIFKVQGDHATAQPAHAGEYATIYLTGQGGVSPPIGTGQPAPADPLSRAVLPVTVGVGGLSAEVQYAGLAPGFVGLMQLNFRVPDLGPGDYPISVSIGGVPANSALISVTAAKWSPDAKVARTGEYQHAGKTYFSSTSLRVEWSAPSAVVHHYLITATEKRSTVQIEVPGTAREVIIRDLKAGTEYSLNLRACLNSACSDSLQSTEALPATTEEEYWRIQGRGNSYATADRLVPDGNVGSYALRYGKWAGPELDGKIQLYYNPLQADEKGIKIGELIAPRADSIAAASAFRGVSGYGLQRVCIPSQAAPGVPVVLPPECSDSNNLATALALFQAVPLTPEAGAKVRLFFEAAGGDGRTRILYLDSHDGYVGRDFHSGAPTRCMSIADYAPGGGCQPKLAIGVDIDREGGNPNLLNARQFKIGYPVQDSWVWDMKPGTYMWFTTEWQDRRCSAFGFNVAYAVWSGTKWEVAYQKDGCPKLLPGAQAPAIVHLGGARYKMYFNLHPIPSGVTNPQIALKPMHMLYADPAATGDPAIVDFEDWEPKESAREIHYLWPSGEPLTEDEESKLDDYVVFAPTADSGELIMYSNMAGTGAQSLPFIGSAVLVNP